MPLYRDFTFVPDAVPPPSRDGAVPTRINNGTPSTAVSVAAQCMVLGTIFIPRGVSINNFSIRTSGGAAWPNASALDYTIVAYSNGKDNLPSQRLLANSFVIPAGTGTNTWVTNSISIKLGPGVTWFGIAAHGTTIELAGNNVPSFDQLLFQKMVGTGSTQTSNHASLITQIPANFATPLNLDSRTLNMTFISSPNQTSFGLRANAVATWMGYTV